MNTTAAKMWGACRSTRPKRGWTVLRARVSAADYEEAVLVARADAAMRQIQRTGGIDYDDFRRSAGLV
jgi:hypothetical protein